MEKRGSICAGGMFRCCSSDFYLAMIDGEEEQHKFEQLYHTYEGLLLYRAKQLLSDFQLAEEAASTTFVYIAKNMNMVEQVECSPHQSVADAGAKA